MSKFEKSNETDSLSLREFDMDVVAKIKTF